METVKKHNEDRYNEYLENTRKHQNNFKASGYCSMSGWRLRRSLVEHMVSFIDKSSLEILDMGCNNGLTGRELCSALNRRNIRTSIDGIDFVESALEIARSSFGYRSTFVSDITNKELINSLLDGRTYSLVHCCEVFHYINPEDYRDYFAAVSSALEPDGYFLLVLPNVRSLSHLIVKTLKRDVFDGSFKFDYDVPRIKSLFTEYGFAIKSIYGADILSGMKIDLEGYNQIKNLFSYEIAVLAKKAR